MKTKLRIGIYVICISVIMTCGFYWLVNYFFPPKIKEVDSSWIEVIGTVTKIGYGRSGGGHIEFDFNGKHYRTSNGRNLFASVTGEKYPLILNPKDPNEIVIKEWHPIFTSNEEINWTSGRISSLACVELAAKYRTVYTADCNIEYEYTVDGEVYSRNQTLPPAYVDTIGKINVDDIYPIQYLESNPQRAVIKLR